MKKKLEFLLKIFLTMTLIHIVYYAKIITADLQLNVIMIHVIAFFTLNVQE
jgi:hypothetical protein